MPLDSEKKEDEKTTAFIKGMFTTIGLLVLLGYLEKGYH